MLYYGDNLDVLRRHIEAKSVDLVYLDPPFNSNATYNVLFAEHDGSQAAAQIKAFGDTWHWDEASSRAYQEIVEVGGKVSQALQAFRQMLGESDESMQKLIAEEKSFRESLIAEAQGKFRESFPAGPHRTEIIADGGDFVLDCTRNDD